MFFMLKVFNVKSAENHHDKNGSQLWCHSRVINFKYLRNNWSTMWNLLY